MIVQYAYFRVRLTLSHGKVHCVVVVVFLVDGQGLQFTLKGGGTALKIGLAFPNSIR